MHPMFDSGAWEHTASSGVLLVLQSLLGLSPVYSWPSLLWLSLTSPSHCSPCKRVLSNLAYFQLEQPLTPVPRCRLRIQGDCALGDNGGIGGSLTRGLLQASVSRPDLGFPAGAGTMGLVTGERPALQGHWSVCPLVRQLDPEGNGRRSGKPQVHG